MFHMPSHGYSCPDSLEQDINLRIIEKSRGHPSTQQTLIGLHDMSWRRLQYIFISVTIFRLPRRLEDVLKTFWRCLGRWKIVMLKTSSRAFKTCLEDVLKTCLKDILKEYFQNVLKMSWRQTKCLLGISVYNKSKSVSNKFISHKYISDESMVNPKYIKLNNFEIRLILKFKQHFHFKN